jgi:hypothetical protein
LSHVVAAEKMLGHEVKVFKFDRAPEIDCETLKRRVESELHVRVLIGPSGEHECVARAEALMGTALTIGRKGTPRDHQVPAFIMGGGIGVP